MTSVAMKDQLAQVANRAANIADMFFARVSKTPDREAFRFPDADNHWHSRTWREVGVEATELAAGLIDLGIEPEDRVAIAAATRYEWVLADLATNLAAAATTTVYPSTMADDVAFIISDSQSRIVFAENDEQIAKLRSKRSELPDVMNIVTFDGATDDDWVIGIAELAERGRAHLIQNPSALTDRAAKISPDSLATLVYTSGTTGRPKGVRLIHDAWTYQAAACASTGVASIDDVHFLWLPMAHVFGKIMLVGQMEIGFVTAIDGRVSRILDNLELIKPTFMGSAPRIFEKAYAAAIADIVERGGADLRIYRWAERVGLEYGRRIRQNDPIPIILRAQRALADKLVFRKIRARFGGRIRCFLSGSASLNHDIAEWFHACGMPVLESYGLTETAAGAFANPPERIKVGTVGTALPGTEVRIAEDGEILLRGPQIMQGYHNLDSATAAAIDGDGWFATGDIGTLDSDGYLTITDRKKELFKTSGGKYVAPSHIESVFKGVCPLASQMIVHGNERNFCTALITLDPVAVDSWARAHGMAGSSYSQVVTSARMNEEVGHYVDQLNAQLNRWESIKKFEILPQELSIEAGELTPSLKIKRRVVEERNRSLLNSFYR
ncbi:AMP-dependent synthetase/ligase [Rhodococcus opacus]|uniref:AMP-dependent synthetase/ligase n=1 Tax=Rhodococcus opacus TaxID=37919 RepID=UPI001C47A18A|nr:long-chain fatty acid--CoA ligase [Rhodococcus opacus]MBV6760405.1 long-chain fatty acid--CoA ligase [Rhodococcus opacus]